MHHTFTLSGGLQLLVEELPHTHSVSVGCFVGVGSGHEQRPTCGISHFIEHLLFKGSQGYPTPKLISDAIEGVGGVIDAYTGFESTVYYAKVADIHVQVALDVLSDMIIRPRFDPADIEKERRVILEELAETEDSPADLVHVLLDLAMWGDQPLGRDIAGDEESLHAITREAIVAWWRETYNRANIIISIAGNIRAEQARDAVEAAFAALPEGAAPAFVASAPARPGPALLVQPDDSEQGNFALAMPGVAQNDPDRRALLAFDTIVGNGMSSRLFQEIREELGLAYSIGSYSREHHDAGKWLIYGSVDPDKLEECLATIMRELRAVKEQGVTEAELRRVKEQVKGGILLSLEDTWSVASRNGSHQQRYGRVIPVEQVVAEVEAVTLEDVRRVGRRVLKSAGLHLAVIGPYDEEQESLAALLDLG